MQVSLLAFTPSSFLVSLLAFTPSSFLFRVCLGEATNTLTFLTSNIPHSFYSESLLYMPASYHVNSHSMRFKEPRAPPSGAAALAGARIAAGLPESGTLFCSYNQFFKIDEGILRAWSAILARDPSSWLVLVKFMFYEYAGPRLSRMIGERGAREGQLVLAEKKGTGEHIERSALMDLHVDTRSLVLPQFPISTRLFPFPANFIPPPKPPKSTRTSPGDLVQSNSIQRIEILIYWAQAAVPPQKIRAAVSSFMCTCLPHHHLIPPQSPHHQATERAYDNCRRFVEWHTCSGLARSQHGLTSGSR